MLQKRILRALVVGLALLLVPLAASQFVDGWNWSPLDYVFAAVMFTGTGIAYVLATHRASQVTYKAAVALALAAGFMLVWGNLAVGFIGEDNPANALVFGVLVIGLIGTALTRFRPRGMAYAMFAMALAQPVVPVFALLVDPGDFAPGVTKVFVLTAFFVGLWVMSGLLFRHAAETSPQAVS